MTQQYIFFSAPCVPVHVQSFTSCEDSLGSVSWAESDGADSYLAIAVGQEGHTHMCTTNTTSCTWDNLHCGDFYTVHIIANDYMCSSMPSNSTTLRMGKQAFVLCTARRKKKLSLNVKSRIFFNRPDINISNILKKTTEWKDIFEMNVEN